MVAAYELTPELSTQPPSTLRIPVSGTVYNGEVVGYVMSQRST